MEEKIEIYTDGACLDNPGPGGWGAILLADEATKRLSGSVQDTTSQQMELLAAAKGLEALKQPMKVILYTDSAYLVNAFKQDWLKGWKQRNWSRKQGTLKNKFLWVWLDTLTDRHEVKFEKVKGHSGVKWNEEVDDLARAAAKKIAGSHSQPSTTKRATKQTTKQQQQLKYKDKLMAKAEEFIVQLQKNNFQSRIVDVFQYHITISLASNGVNCGNIRIYYKPSKNRYSLGFQELKKESLTAKLEELWQQI